MVSTAAFLFGDWVPRLDGCREPLSPPFYISTHECEFSRSWKLAHFRSSCGHIFGACAGFYAALVEMDVEIARRTAPDRHRRRANRTLGFSNADNSC